MTQNADRIWKAAKSIRPAMLVTRNGAQLVSRPMAAIVRADDGVIWFLTDRDSGKLDDIARDPQVSVSFCDSSNQIAFTGVASVHDDRAIIKDLWSTAAQAWYPKGPSDPLVLALRIDPSQAELWDGPGAIVALVKMAAAVATGSSVRGLSAISCVAGIMGKKEIPYISTQRICDSERPSRPAAGIVSHLVV
jgi:general stress protein 26